MWAWGPGVARHIRESRLESHKRVALSGCIAALEPDTSDHLFGRDKTKTTSKERDIREKKLETRRE